ncbi:aminotransferase class IV [Mesoaciditoga sp.]
MKVYSNGEWKEDAVVSVYDRGFMYGEGIYESLRTYNGRLFAPHQHYERLKRSAQLMGLPCKLDYDELISIIQDGIENLDKDVTIRVMVTTGDGKETNLLIYIMELQAPHSDLYTYGVDVGISRLRKIPSICLPSTLKTTSHAYLSLARREKREFYEIIFLNYQGFVAEGTMSNVFLVEDGTLVTPSLESDILDGITRRVVIELATSLGISVEERFVNVDELFNCSELFLTRTSAGIIPVRRIENRTIFENEPSGLTTLLSDNFKDYIFNEEKYW